MSKIQKQNPLIIPMVRSHKPGPPPGSDRLGKDQASSILGSRYSGEG